jgi:mannosyltransferase OCH1-like enzyme
MLPYSAQARLTIAASVFVFLASVHYFFFPSLSRLDFNVVTENVELDSPVKNATVDVIGEVADEVTTPSPKERWPIKWIPEKHWQSWKLSVADLEPVDLECMRTWRVQNPFHRYEAFTDDSAESFVREAYTDTRPDIVETYFAIKDKIAREFSRHLLICWGETKIVTFFRC